MYISETTAPRRIATKLIELSNSEVPGSSVFQPAFEDVAVADQRLEKPSFPETRSSRPGAGLNEEQRCDRVGVSEDLGNKVPDGESGEVKCPTEVLKDGKMEDIPCDKEGDTSILLQIMQKIQAFLCNVVYYCKNILGTSRINFNY